MFDNAGLGCLVCCPIPLIMIFLIIMTLLEKIFDKRWLP